MRPLWIKQVPIHYTQFGKSREIDCLIKIKQPGQRQYIISKPLVHRPNVLDVSYSFNQSHSLILIMIFSLEIK